MSDINYPTLSGLINITQLPESLYFIHEGLASFLDNIYYRKYRVYKSSDRTTYSVFIELLSDKAIAAEIPGTGGFKIIFNPELSDSR